MFRANVFSGGAIGVYAKLLKSMSLGTRPELMEYWSKNGRQKELTNVVETLWEVEDEWDSFLEELDKVIVKSVVNPAPICNT